jgi:hypothetical protein
MVSGYVQWLFPDNIPPFLGRCDLGKPSGLLPQWAMAGEDQSSWGNVTVRYPARDSDQSISAMCVCVVDKYVIQTVPCGHTVFWNVKPEDRVGAFFFFFSFYFCVLEGCYNPAFKKKKKKKKEKK